MQITVKLFSGFRFGRFKEATLEYADGVTVAELLQSLDINGQRGVVLVNGKTAPHTQILCDGDILTLFPLVSGG